jgi:hypothetical protein
MQIVCKPRNQIFISHSAKDEEISSFFIRKFGNTSVKPALMEYEKWPNWKWIKDEIQKSSALLILIKDLVRNEYTQNRAAFEIGVTAQYRFLYLEKITLIFQRPI